MKVIDENGFWLYKDNPVTKEGVFPYLGKQIHSDLEPNKIYYVYRPYSEIANPEFLESFNGMPLSDDHDMLGDGFMEYDNKPASGVIFDLKTDDTNKRVLGNIKVFSESMKEKINAGKKELSLGYLCSYEERKGEFDGQKYDFVQTNLRGNHIALVEKGRMGADVRVYDRALTMDSMDIVVTPSEDGVPQQGGEESPQTIEDNAMEETNQKACDSKREVIREIMAIAGKPDSDFEGGEEEKIETIAKLLEKSEYSEDESDTESKAKDESEKAPAEEKAEDKCGKDEEETSSDESEEKSQDADESKAQDEESVKEEVKGDKTAEDSAKLVLKELDERASLKDALRPVIGSFASDGMTSQEVALYGCKKLGLEVAEDEAKAVLKGYLSACKKEQVYGVDSSSYTSAIDKGIENYLK